MDIKEFRRLGAKRIKARDEEAALADQLRPLVVEALESGMRPADVVKITGWSAAQIRTIARVGGVGPATRGRDPLAGYRLASPGRGLPARSAGADQ